MLTHKITPSVDYNYWLKRLDTQFNKPTIQKSLKVPKVVKPTNKKTLLLTVHCHLFLCLLLDRIVLFFIIFRRQIFRQVAKDDK